MVVHTPHMRAESCVCYVIDYLFVPIPVCDSQFLFVFLYVDTPPYLALHNKHCCSNIIIYTAIVWIGRCIVHADVYMCMLLYVIIQCC